MTYDNKGQQNRQSLAVLRLLLHRRLCSLASRSIVNAMPEKSTVDREMKQGFLRFSAAIVRLYLSIPCHQIRHLPGIYRANAMVSRCASHRTTLALFAKPDAMFLVACYAGNSWAEGLFGLKTS